MFDFCLIFFKLGYFFSSTHAFVWDCNPAFWVQIFYPIWPTKITEKPLNTNFVKNEKQNDDYY